MSKLIYENEGVALSVSYDRTDAFDGKHGWFWAISEVAEDGERLSVMAHGDDLRTATYDMVGALRSLVSFMQAWDEAMGYGIGGGENAELFPHELHARLDWASWLDEAHCDLEWED